MYRPGRAPCARGMSQTQAKWEGNGRIMAPRSSFRIPPGCDISSSTYTPGSYFAKRVPDYPGIWGEANGVGMEGFGKVRKTTRSCGERHGGMGEKNHLFSKLSVKSLQQNLFQNLLFLGSFSYLLAWLACLRDSLIVRLCGICRFASVLRMHSVLVWVCGWVYMWVYMCVHMSQQYEGKQ